MSVNRIIDYFDGGNKIIIDREVCSICNNYFVYDIMGKIEARCFTFSTSGGWETERGAYSKAAEYYNRFVPENEWIPLF